MKKLSTHFTLIAWKTLVWRANERRNAHTHTSLRQIWHFCEKKERFTLEIYDIAKDVTTIVDGGGGSWRVYQRLKSDLRHPLDDNGNWSSCTSLRFRSAFTVSVLSLRLAGLSMDEWALWVITHQSDTLRSKVKNETESVSLSSSHVWWLFHV